MAEGGDRVPQNPTGRGRGLRFGTPTQREPLRQPRSGYVFNNTSHINLGGNPGPSDDIFQSSSVTVPPTTSYHSSTNDTVLRESQVPKKIELSPLAKEFVPRSVCNNSPVLMRQPALKEELASETAEQVSGMMSALALNPGQFDVFVPAFLEMVNHCLSSNELMKTVTDTIFDKSVTEPNLRYNGARLCNYLSENLDTESSGKIFRQLLLTRCQEEFDKREATLNDSRKTSWLHGVVHFMGELFIHLELVGPDGNAQKVKILGIGLCQFLELLLGHASDENLKCVSQVLKFTGAALEDEFHSNSDHPFEKVFDKIKTTLHNTNTSRSITDMFTKIIELRGSNWGRATLSPVLKEEPFMGDFHCVSYTGDPVFYGPDGQPITSEETQFLESNQFLYEGEGEDDFSDFADYGQGEVWSTEDDQMDDEIAAAYEEFLAQQGTNQKV